MFYRDFFNLFIFVDAFYEMNKLQSFVLFFYNFSNCDESIVNETTNNIGCFICSLQKNLSTLNIQLYNTNDVQ